MKLKIATAVVVALFVAVVVVPKEAKRLADWRHSSTVKADVIEQIKGRIKSPATFDLVDWQVLGHTFDGTFDAQNQFGAVIRTAFRGKWKDGRVIDLELTDPTAPALRFDDIAKQL